MRSFEKLRRSLPSSQGLTGTRQELNKACEDAEKKFYRWLYGTYGSYLPEWLR